eukprot:TRINITY_DN353_c0_g1_i3.p1 TRINITY_DN353_c0_g1~~TRINITY_DN353_c0_g1_i3.p1  ORF type:complete len:1720 (+),score=722.35 TRINITY_DN353_c0_g1_i3:1758-6917(+)
MSLFDDDGGFSRDTRSGASANLSSLFGPSGSGGVGGKEAGGSLLTYQAPKQPPAAAASKPAAPAAAASPAKPAAAAAHGPAAASRTLASAVVHLHKFEGTTSTFVAKLGIALSEQRPPGQAQAHYNLVLYQGGQQQQPVQIVTSSNVGQLGSSGAGGWTVQSGQYGYWTDEHGQSWSATFESAADCRRFTLALTVARAASAGYKKLVTQDMLVGDKGQPVQAADECGVKYCGWLVETASGQLGAQFVDRSEKTSKLTVGDWSNGRGCRGWHDAVRGMRRHGTRLMVLPAEMGYAPGAAPANVPANAVLVFEMELLRWRRPEADAPSAPGTPAGAGTFSLRSSLDVSPMQQASGSGWDGASSSASSASDKPDLLARMAKLGRASVGLSSLPPPHSPAAAHDTDDDDDSGSEQHLLSHQHQPHQQQQHQQQSVTQPPHADAQAVAATQHGHQQQQHQAPQPASAYVAAAAAGQQQQQQPHNNVNNVVGLQPPLGHQQPQYAVAQHQQQPLIHSGSGQPMYAAAGPHHLQPLPLQVVDPTQQLLQQPPVALLPSYAPYPPAASASPYSPTMLPAAYQQHPHHHLHPHHPAAAAAAAYGAAAAASGSLYGPPVGVQQQSQPQPAAHTHAASPSASAADIAAMLDDRRRDEQWRTELRQSVDSLGSKVSSVQAALDRSALFRLSSGGDKAASDGSGLGAASAGGEGGEGGEGGVLAGAALVIGLQRLVDECDKRKAELAGKQQQIESMRARMQREHERHERQLHETSQQLERRNEALQLSNEQLRKQAAELDHEHLALQRRLDDATAELAAQGRSGTQLAQQLQATRDDLQRTSAMLSSARAEAAEAVVAQHDAVARLAPVEQALLAERASRLVLVEELAASRAAGADMASQLQAAQTHTAALHLQLNTLVAQHEAAMATAAASHRQASQAQQQQHDDVERSLQQQIDAIKHAAADELAAVQQQLDAERLSSHQAEARRTDAEQEVQRLTAALQQLQQATPAPAATTAAVGAFDKAAMADAIKKTMNGVYFALYEAIDDDGTYSGQQAVALIGETIKKATLDSIARLEKHGTIADDDDDDADDDDADDDDADDDGADDNDDEDDVADDNANADEDNADTVDADAGDDEDNNEELRPDEQEQAAAVHSPQADVGQQQDAVHDPSDPDSEAAADDSDAEPATDAVSDNVAADTSAEPADADSQDSADASDAEPATDAVAESAPAAVSDTEAAADASAEPATDAVSDNVAADTSAEPADADSQDSADASDAEPAPDAVAATEAAAAADASDAESATDAVPDTEAAVADAASDAEPTVGAVSDTEAASTDDAASDTEAADTNGLAGAAVTATETTVAPDDAADGDAVAAAGPDEVDPAAAELVEAHPHDRLDAGADDVDHNEEETAETDEEVEAAEENSGEETASNEEPDTEQESRHEAVEDLPRAATPDISTEATAVAAPLHDADSSAPQQQLTVSEASVPAADDQQHLDGHHAVTAVAIAAPAGDLVGTSEASVPVFDPLLADGAVDHDGASDVVTAHEAVSPEAPKVSQDEQRTAEPGLEMLHDSASHTGAPAVDARSTADSGALIAEASGDAPVLPANLGFSLLSETETASSASTGSTTNKSVLSFESIDDDDPLGFLGGSITSKPSPLSTSAVVKKPSSSLFEEDSGFLGTKPSPSVMKKTASLFADDDDDDFLSSIIKKKDPAPATEPTEKKTSSAFDDIFS